MLKETFQVYLNRLIDLSAKNRSIYLPKLIASQMVDMEKFHLLDNKEAVHYIHELIGRKKRIPLIKVLHARDKNSNKLSKILTRLQHSVKFAEEETGEKNLFVGWPFIEGKLINDQLIKGPLLFFPVELSNKDGVWWLLSQENDPPIFNRSFLLAYAHATGQALDKEWLETSLEDFPTDPTAFTTALYHHLNKALSLNFNQELFEQKISVYQDSSRAIDNEDFQTGKLKLKPFAVLGQFSQKGSFLINDYEDLMDTPGPDSLEELFSERFAVDPADLTEVKEDNLFNVFPIDASQEEVIKEVRSGKSVVVEGPPGTGKSQLICNLVSDYTSRGKRVLVVSQKRAALDVVYDRLEKKGFGAFMALVHDFRSDRKDLFKKISSQIGALNTYQELNRSLDAIQLERSFSQATRTITSLSEYLEEYRSALYNTEECGIPVKQLYVTGSSKDKGFDLNQYYKNYPWDRVEDFFRDFKLFREYALKYQTNKSFWLHRLDFSSFSQGALARMGDTIEEITQLKSSAEKTLQTLMGESFNYLFIYECYEHKSSFEDLQKLIQDETEYKQFNNLLEYDASEFDLLWLRGKIDTFKKLLREEIEWTLPDEEVEDYYHNAILVLEAKSSWLGSVGMFFDRKNYSAVIKLLEANGLKDDKEGIKRLMSRLEARMNLNHQYTLLDGKDWLTLPKKPFGLEEFEERVISLVDRIKARLIIEEIGLLRPYLANTNVDFLIFHQTLEELLGIVHLLDYKISIWSNYLTKIQIQHLLTYPNQSMVDEVREGLSQSFTDLVLFDKLKHSIRSMDWDLMTKLLQHYPELSFNEIKENFLIGLRFSWVEHIETKYPVLQEVTSPKISHVLDEISAAISDKEDISIFIAELKLRERVIDKLEYNRLNNLLTYRELSHQVRKKKKLWPIKKLIENFEEEIFRLIPCWLASPETVSALFPLDQTFDLVIFDESSQCFVEKGVPAMLRGKQTVVAGDSQQLQPFDLYKVRWETEEEGIELEVESLLDLCSNYFQKYFLQGHYRSQSLSLIQFSNQHFYEDKLEMIPQMDLVNSDFNAFDLIKVEGVWQQQTNPVEAEEVLNQLIRCQKEYPHETIGVITFNYYQMELIQDMVFDHQGIDNTYIKVKNIENVQGDEFDHVVFSIGYAKNSAGKFTANYGLLARREGEHRLNVAITRARKRITLVTSMIGEDFKVQHLQHEGVKLLRAYLNYVHQIVNGRKVEIDHLPVSGFSNNWLLTEHLQGPYEGYELSPQRISNIYDLTVMKDRNYSGAILTDDKRLYGTPNVKAIFVYHPELLKSKGWRVIQIFSRQYWLEGDKVLEKYLKQTRNEKNQA